MENEGEANRTAARRFNEAQTRYANSEKVEPAARAAVKAVDSSEGETLRQAEEEGKRRSAVPDSAREPSKNQRT